MKDHIVLTFFVHIYSKGARILTVFESAPAPLFKVMLFQPQTAFSD